MRASEGFVNYAHRGASEYTPENTMLAFYTGMYMGANGIETDVQRTKDGVLVLFHDETVDRVTNGSGALADFTLAELQQLDVTKNGLVDKIVVFEDFLKHFAFRDIVFAIELKGPGVEEETADLLRKYNMLEKTVVTSSELAHLKNFRAYAPEFETGYLAGGNDGLPLTPELDKTLLDLGITEICPKVEGMNPDMVKHWHDIGLRVRAWGAFDEELMQKTVDWGTDGTTCNFPDKLVSYLAEKE